MKKLKGQAVFEDIVFGKIYFCEKSKIKVPKYTIKDVQAEVYRFEKAKNKTVEQLKGLYDEAKQKVLDYAAMIFEIYEMMLEDEDYSGRVKKIITEEKQNAEYAVDVVAKKYSKEFLSLNDEYMRERAEDIGYMSDRLIVTLLNEENIYNKISTDEPVILAAENFSPGETIKLDKNIVLGFITQNGSKTSHAAILSKTMEIPAVVGLGQKLSKDIDGCNAIIDSVNGEVYINPDKFTISKFKIKQSEQRELKKLLKLLKGKENITKDRQKINISADLGNADNLDILSANDVDGIGLFRTEFLFSNKNVYPTQDRQFDIYKAVITNEKAKTCCIRTFDIGSDGQYYFIDMPKEINPALGIRSSRIYFEYPQVFKEQIKAILRAGVFGKVSIVIPFISSINDIKRVKMLIDECKTELELKNIEFKKNVPLGVIIETPAAVMLSYELAKEVDFFQIGTNDLTQYTLAIDRQNIMFSEYVKDCRVALLRMINIVIKNAHKNNINVAICGELSSDTELLPYYLAMRVDEIITHPSNVLKLRKKVRSTDVAKIQDKLIAEIE